MSQILLVAATLFLAGPADADAIEDAMRATVRIAAGVSSGTAFFVSLETPAGKKATVLVTAAHVLDSLPGDTGVAVLRVKAKDGFARKEVPMPIRKAGKPLWTKHAEVDIAVLAFEPPPGTDIQPFPYARIADAKVAEDRKIRVGDDVVIPCFPAKAEGNPAGWPILRKGSIATHPLFPLASARTIYIDYSHFGGDSGSPVVAIRDKKPLVVGLVIAMLRQTDRASTTFEERTIHTPLGLAMTLQSPLVRQAIEQWRARK